VTDAPADIEAFVAQFESGRLPRAGWTHEAHLLIALWYLAKHDEAAALPIVRQRIRAYNEAVGTVNSDHGGYHESLTRLYLRGIAAHRAAHPAPSPRRGVHRPAPHADRAPRLAAVVLLAAAPVLGRRTARLGGAGPARACPRQPPPRPRRSRARVPMRCDATALRAAGAAPRQT
jgi:hypothetical protein